MNMRLLAAGAALLLPVIVLGQTNASHTCTMGELTRRVEIFSEPGVTVPCEVHYYKDTEAPGERQVLWSASSQEGYCEQKTREFVEELENWGWDCGRVGAEPSGGDAAEETAVEAPEAEMEALPTPDDTEALAPADTEAVEDSMN